MGEKILIVDDDLESVKLIGLMLQRRGYEITAAQSGDQALLKAEAEAPDLVILDVMMPDMDGYQVCRNLRANPRTAHLPVLMFTAKTLVGDKVEGFQSGADDYLTKPVHPAELVSRVESLLHRLEETQAETQRGPRTQVVGVLGVKGGVGVSTLVVNLAVAMHQRNDLSSESDGHARVSIADLKLGQGSVALLLGGMSKGGLATLVGRTPDSLDQQTVEEQVVTHSSGVKYLPASLQPRATQGHLSVAHLNPVLTSMMATSDCLFLDLGSTLDEATRHAVARCDIVLVVVEPQRLCLTLAPPFLDEIQSMDPPPRDLRIVMVERPETNQVYTQKEVENSLGQEIFAIINAAPDLAHQAVEQGQPIVLLNPESEIAQQFRDLSQELNVP